MYNLVASAQAELRKIVDAAFSSTFSGAVSKEYVIEIPKDTSHGDFACNVAMINAKALGKAPRMIAEALVATFLLDGSYFTSAEVAGPGFINFKLGARWFSEATAAVISDGESYGRSDYGKGQKVMVEFVSANPTGPMHMGNARGGAIGDCLAAALDFAGFEVTREFYINDAGNQIAKFGLSLEVRYLQELNGEDTIEFPEDGYHGEDIRERAREYIALHGGKLLDVPSEQRQSELVEYALPANIAKLKSDLERYKIEYDVWFSENSLYASGAVDEAVAELTKRDMTYEKDGALWYKAAQQGADKDEVLIRTNGNPTYFTSDIAYHYNKFAVRGFDRVINVWGADHHGHVARLKGAVDAIGLDGSRLDIVLMQLVRLMKNGEPFKMSKRTGKSITLTDLLEEIPIDAARFFFNMREPNSTLDFDLDLAVEETSQNPVYYVQYAHARICSIIRNLAAEGIVAKAYSEIDFTLLTAEEERELIRKLATLPNDIIMSARTYDPAKLTHFVIDTAALFHKFYGSCRVRGEDETLMQARLSLCVAVKITLGNVLSLLKIAAPEVM